MTDALQLNFVLAALSFGPIIAAPLARPVSRTSLPPTGTLCVATLMRVSVVRMACAA